MPKVTSDGVLIHYEIKGEGSPVLLLAGLAGTGKSWGPQIDLFAGHHQVIVPDHRGTGASEHTARGMTIAQHARDMARVIEAIGCGPVHVVGSSTGGAIAQLLAIHHRGLLRSATIVSSIARADAFYRRQFDMRRRMLTDSGLRASTEANALFLFAASFTREHPERVQAWVNATAAGPFEPDISFARIDMIVGHDAFDDLPSIATPTLVVVGQHDFCAPPYFSAELAERIPGAEFVVLDGGHFIFLEQPELLHDTVEAFIAKQASRPSAKTLRQELTPPQELLSQSIHTQTRNRIMVEKKALTDILSTVKYLPNRTPHSGFTGEASAAFAAVSPYRDGAIYVGHYSGSSEWERHGSGDEIVLVLEGTTTVVLLSNGTEQRIQLGAGELVVVPKALWHRFESSMSLKVMSVTPAPTDHALERPDA